jgi:chemotaxis protein methyltransferase CheR
MMIDAGVDLAQQDCARLRKLITEYSGWDESLQTDGALEQAVARRLTARRLSSLADYWPLIQRGSGDDGEVNKLVQLLANKETSLFREMHQFEVLRDWVLPGLLAARDRPLRLWSAGCATGEEPYSLAITLLEYQARFGELEAQVIGTDIDPNGLEKARQGCYGERSLRLVPDDLRQRYFTLDGRTYRVTPEVAQLVTFRVHNLAEDHCPPDLMNLDVIFCRNVTIYFDDSARDRLNARLADSLREGGYLFVASAETMGHNRGRLELVSAGDTFLFRKKRPAPAPPRTKRPTVEPPSLVPSRPRHREHTEGSPQSSADGPAVAERGAGLDATTSLAGTSLLQRAFRAFQHQDYRSALRELDRLPADQLLPPQARCLRGAILLQQERLDEAEAACQRLLAQDPWHADAHFLLGLVYRHQGQTDAAIQTLKQAIYLQPSHRDAHFYLAETYRTEGMTAKARREYENTLNTLRVVHPPKGSPAFSLSGLEDDMLRQACEVNLRKLRGRS